MQPVHDDVIKRKHFPRYWSYVRGIHLSAVDSNHKGQWRGDLMFSLICAWANGWVNNRNEMPVIWDAIVLIMTSIWRHFSFNVNNFGFQSDISSTPRLQISLELTSGFGDFRLIVGIPQGAVISRELFNLPRRLSDWVHLYLNVH